MAECLGMYLDNNFIKYAKVIKEKDIIRIDAVGVKHYETVEDTINQIIKETKSERTPISVNLNEEAYNYFEIFAMLNKKDIDRSIKTEFEYMCEEQEMKPNTLETKYFVVPSKESKEKVRAVHIFANRSEIAKKTQQFKGSIFRNLSPLPIALPTLIDIDARENFVILNIEEKTTLTFVIDGTINKVQIIDEGMKSILDKISAKENSYTKAYEICKNSTLYTLEGMQNLEENAYLEDIMPTLYIILQKTREAIKETISNISKMYITGSAALMNNIDLYFQEQMEKIKCQILKPYFITAGMDNTNVKDYIEVNSAIAMAMVGLGEGIKKINFKEVTLSDKLPKIDLKLGKIKKNENSSVKTKFTMPKFTFDKSPLVKLEKNCIRLSVLILISIIAFSIMSNVIGTEQKNKQSEIDTVSTEINAELSKMNSDLSQITNKTNEYSSAINRLNNTTSENTVVIKRKNDIPNLLNRIMFIVPTELQVVEINNMEGEHIKITVQSKKYEQIAYFKAQLGIDEILLNVKSDTSTTSEDGNIKVTIEGDLP